MVYKLEQDNSPTKLRITKTSRNPTSATDTTAPIARVDYTTLERTGTHPAFTWTLVDWTQVGHTPLTREVRQWSGNTSGGHDELITQLNATDEVVSLVDRVHTGYPWGHTPTQMVVGDVNAVAANTEYNTDSAQIGSYGMPRLNTSTGGAWSIMEYQSTTNTDKAGVVSRTFAPYLNQPATPPPVPDLNQGVVTSYTYANDAFGMPTRVTSVETKINGVLVSKSTSTYGSASANGQQLVHRTTLDQSNQAGVLIQTDMSYYREDTYDEFIRGQIRMSNPSSGAKQSYIRQRGNLNAEASTFSVQANGKATRIGVVTGSSLSSPGATYLTTHAGYDLADLYILPNKSTLEWTIRDASARVRRTESHVWDGSSWQLVGWTNFEYNLNSQLVSSVSHTGDLYEAGYSGEFKIWERDASGTLVEYEYDRHGRQTRVVRPAFGTDPDSFTEAEYDAAHRVVRRTSGSSVTSETLVSEMGYDLAGRVTWESTPGAGTRTFAYDPVNRRVTATAPDLTTLITETYMDGQAYSQTGSGVVPSYTTYGVEPDGRRWTRTDVLNPTSPRWQKGWVDWLNRPVRAERPGFAGQANFVEENFYDATTGLLARTARTGTASTLHAYDSTGTPTLTALDVNQNGQIDLAGPDSVSGSERWMAFEEGAWWAASRSYSYLSAGSAAETTLGSSRQRLNGFTGTLRGETRSTDVEGNVASSLTYVDRATRTVTNEQRAPGVANPAVSISINGLVTTSSAPDGLSSTSTYDALRRPVSAVDPRTGTYTTTYYPGTTLVHTQIDARDVTVATHTYDVLGRRIASTDADGKTSRVMYHPLGGVSRQWGDTAIPVSYGYDDYGQRVTQSTYRAGTSWNSSSWPAATTGNADTTTWTYDEATGLLKKKTDATNRYVEYAYNVRGQPTHRYWARTVNVNGVTQRVTATYAYDPVTADPLGTSYNDGTPGTSLTYDRSGRPLTRADAAGTRTYAYDPVRPWRFAGETLPAYFGNRVLTPQRSEITTSAGAGYGPHQLGTVKGSQNGYALGTAADPTRDLRVLYHTANSGRLAGLQAYGPGGGHGGTGAFHYTYTADSRLVAGLHAPQAGSAAGYSLTRGYESKRDLLTSIETTWGSATQVRYEYAYDDRARRTRAVQGGDAFEADYGDPVRTDYAYDDRGQLTSADAYLGADPQDTSRPLPGRRHAYGYDTMGNRTTSSHHSPDSTKTAGYRTNALNQYTDRDNKGVPYRGVARADAPVAVDGQLAARQERYFWQDVNFAADPAGRLFPLAAALAGAAPGGKDAVQLAYRFAFWPGANEVFTYDEDGNLTQDGTWIYTYDAENRLVQMEGKSWTAMPGAPPRQRLVFSYDYQGRRIGKTVYNLGTGTSDVQLQQDLRFIYDGWNLIAELDATQPGLPLLRSYAWGLDLVGSLRASGGVGALVQIWDHVNDKRYLPAYDGNGNLAALFDAQAATMAAAYEYSPYGEAIRTSGTAAIVQENPFRFSTKYTDVETGLIYYGMRYYDAKNGRFINRDPIEERGGLNLYGFCGNDGINHYDVLGMSWFSSMWKKLKKWVKKNAQIVSIVVGIAAAWALVAFAPASWGLVAKGGSLTVKGAAYAGATAGGVSSFSGTALQGGSLSESLRAGVIGAAIGGASGFSGAGFISKVPAASWVHSSSIVEKAVSGAVSGFVNGSLNTAVYGGKYLRNVGSSTLMSAASSGITEAFAVGMQGLRYSKNSDQVLDSYLADQEIVLEDQQIGSHTWTVEDQRSFLKGVLIGANSRNAYGAGAALLGAAVGGGIGYAVGGKYGAAAGALIGGAYGLYTSGGDIHAGVNIGVQGESSLYINGMPTDEWVARTSASLFTKITDIPTNVEVTGSHYYVNATAGIRPVLFGARLSALDTFVTAGAQINDAGHSVAAPQLTLFSNGGLNNTPLYHSFRSASRMPY